MKLLALFFLAAFGLASAVPAPSNELTLENVEDSGFLLNFAFEADERNDNDDFKNRFGEAIDRILEKVEEFIKSGKSVNEKIVNKLKQIRDKLKEDGFEVDLKARILYEKIKDESSEAYKEFLEGLVNEKRAIEAYAEDEDSTQNDIETKIMKQLDEFMEKLKENKFHLGEKEKDLLRQIRERTRNYWRPVLERLGLEKHIAESYSERLAAVLADKETVLVKVIKEKYEQLFQKIKNEIEKCSDLNLEEIRKKLLDISQKIIEKEVAVRGKLEEKLKEIREEIKNRYSIDILDKGAEEKYVELFGKIRDKLKEIKEKIKNRYPNNNLGERVVDL